MYSKIKQKIRITIWVIVISIWVNFFLFTFLSEGTIYDYIAYDFFLKYFYKQQKSKIICYLLITNESYYNLFKENRVKRHIISESIELLENFGVRQIIFDILFAYPSSKAEDEALSKTLKKYNNIIQPLMLTEMNNTDPLPLNSKDLIKTLTELHIKNQHNNNLRLPYEKFISDIRNLGHINETSDADGIIRHTKVILKKDTIYIPSLGLSAYLNLYRQKLNEIRIQDGLLIIEDKLKIPIDKFGQTLVPFSNEWGRDFEYITIDQLMENSNNEFNRIKLKNFFNGRIVFVADVSSSASDIYSTPFSKISPLVMLHTTMLNSILNNKFIHKLDFKYHLIITNILLFILFFAIYRKKRFYFILFLIITVVLLTTLNIILLISGYYINYSSIIISLFAAFIMGFYILENIFLQEKKMIELDNYHKMFEINETKKIIDKFTPKVELSFDDYEISFYLSTAEAVGGDYIDYYMGDRDVKIFLADGSGHGLQAGLLVVALKTILTSLNLNQNPSSILCDINNILFKIHFSKLFLCLTIVTIRKDKAEFAIAGLPPLLHYQSSSKIISSYRNQNIPLGVKGNFKFSGSSISLNSNDILLIFTDGLNELFNPNKEMLGIQKITNLLSENSDKSSKEILLKYIELISNWKKKSEQNDDISLVVIKKK